MGRWHGARAALLARHQSALHPARTVLDRQERHQDDRHAVMEERNVGWSDLERRRMARGQRDVTASDLCRLEERKTLRLMLSRTHLPIGFLDAAEEARFVG